MTSITDKRITASSHILNLILECDKHDAEKVQSLSNAFLMLSPPQCGGFDLDEEGPVPCGVDAPIPYEPVCGEAPIPYELVTPVEAAPDPVTTPVVTAPAPAKKAPAKKAAAAAKKEAAPAPEPAPTPELPGVLEPPAATDTGEPLSPKEAERFRALIRDTYVAKTKLIATQGDPDNVRRQDFTSKFTAVIESFGAKTVSLAAANDLPAILDAVRAIQA